MQTDFTIVIGGIAGLTTAIALQNLGIQATVFEAAHELALAANAHKAFEHLNINEDAVRAGYQLKQFVIHHTMARCSQSLNSQKKYLSKLHLFYIAQSIGQNLIRDE